MGGRTFISAFVRLGAIYILFFIIACTGRVEPVTDYLIIGGSTIYYFALKFLFFNIYKNTENIAVISTIRSILGIVLTFLLQYLFLNKQITFYNMIAIIWTSIGLIFLI